MRKVVLMMITTLNGRLDDPAAWVTVTSDGVDADFDQMYNTFDTILIGHKAYTEMAGFWPNAETDENVSKVNQSIARKMNAYKKFVFSRSQHKGPLEWNNAEGVHAPTDQDLIDFIRDLKAQSGADIHVVGGARFAQSMIALGLVDEYHFYVYPVVSVGMVWFEQLKNKTELDLINTVTYDKGVVGLYYKPKHN
jgi:dihydrofolate reductase